PAGKIARHLWCPGFSRQAAQTAEMRVPVDGKSATKSVDHLQTALQLGASKTMTRLNTKIGPLILGMLLACFRGGFAQAPQRSVLEQRLNGLDESVNFAQQKITKNISDLLWFQRMQDISVVDKIHYVGPPP